MTLKELAREFAAARARRTYDASMAIFQAWHTVRLWMGTKGRHGKLPDLASQMPGREFDAPRRQSMGQMRTALGVLAQQTGRPLMKNGKPVVM